MRERRRKLHIAEIQTTQGEILQSNQEIKEEAVSFFTDQLRETKEISDFEMLQHIPHIITQEKNKDMVRLPELEEVKGWSLHQMEIVPMDLTGFQECFFNPVGIS